MANSTRKNRRPVAIDLFAGAGGLSLGLEQAGFDVALAVDRDGYHTATHARNFPESAVYCGSVTDLSGQRLRELAGLKGEIDLIAGGPPCQGFSHMGTRDVGDPRNTLVDEYVRLVLEVRPRAFLMENVPGMQTGATSRLFRRAVQALGRHYAITTPVATLNAMSFGVPQRRERLFVLGVRKDIGSTISYPTQPPAGQPERPTVWQALADLPSIGDVATGDVLPYPKAPNATNRYALVARGLADDPSDLSYPRHWQNSQCSGCTAVKHRPDIVALYEATLPGTMVPGHKLPRLDPNGLAPTLRAGSESEHGSYTAPRPVHPLEPRCITSREAARLHGYPDWFRFFPRKWHAYRQIGNSVCPPVARALGREVVRALGARPLRPRHIVALSDEFKLPDERLKQHRRIQQLDEWPKIVAELVSRAVVKGRLARGTFTVRDVERAYRVTGALMPRNPARRFLADVARSRNVRKILAPAHALGLTIEELTNAENAYGRFVPVGTAGAIDDKDQLKLGSRDLANAVRLEPDAPLPADRLALVGLVAHPQVVKDLFSGGRLVVSEKSDTESGRYVFKVLKNRGRMRGVLFVASNGTWPTPSKVAEELKRFNENTAIVAARVTQRHFVVFCLSLHGDRAVVVRQRVFEVQSRDGSAS